MYLFKILQELVKYDKNILLYTGFDGQKLRINTIIHESEHPDKIILDLSYDSDDFIYTIDDFIKKVAHLDDTLVYGTEYIYIYIYIYI